jgi:hypothetical protein
MRFSDMRIPFPKIDSGSAVILTVGMAFRILFAALSWSADWDAFAGMGRDAFLNPGSLYGVYTVPAYFFAFFYAIWTALPISHSYASYIFAMKTPSLIFDFLTALLIFHALTQLNVSKPRVYWAIGAWLLNPLTLIADGFNYFEVVPAFLLLFSAFFAARSKQLSASILLTLAGLLRLVPFIAFPFLVAMALRSRDWKGAIKTVLPVTLLGAGVLAWVIIRNPGMLAGLSGGQGFFRPEVFDVLGVKLSTNQAIYPGSTVAMTALAYLLLLAGVMLFPKAGSSSTRVIATELYLPILAYMAFSFSAPPFLMYAIPFVLIELATRRPYRALIVLFSTVGSLWSIVRSPAYLIQPFSTIFYIPYYTQYWNLHDLAVVWLSNALLIQSYFVAQITAAFSAIILFTIALTVQPVWVRFKTSVGSQKPRDVCEGWSKLQQ